MSVTVFDEKDSVWFVGGRGDGSGGDDELGGCTKEWWDSQCPNKTQAEYDAAYKKIVNSTGGPIAALVNVPYTGDDEDTIYSEGAFEGVEVGMVAYVVENGTPDVNVSTGRYRITAVDDDEITLAGINGSDCNVNVNIGGAFNNLETAMDETSASSYSVDIYTNKDEMLTSQGNYYAGGSVSENSWKRIKGYNTIPGDMDVGGSYYESPLDILQNSKTVDLTKCVTLDGGSRTSDVILIAASCFVFENIHFTNDGSGGDAVDWANTPTSVYFKNCRFTSVVKVSNINAYDFIADSCWSDMQNNHYHPWEGGALILNCVGNVNGNGTFVAAISTGTMKTAVTVIGCIADGNGSGNGHSPFRVLESSTGDCSIYAFNNTFYDFDGEGCMMESGHVYFRNNIFLLSSGAEAFHYVSTGGSVDEDYNCWYTLGGAISPWVVDDIGVNSPPVAGEHDLQVDPLFVDAANGDFRPANGSPCIDAGLSDSMGGWSTMGAYDFSANRGVSKSRVIGGV